MQAGFLGHQYVNSVYHSGVVTTETWSAKCCVVIEVQQAGAICSWSAAEGYVNALMHTM